MKIVKKILLTIAAASFAMFGLAACGDTEDAGDKVEEAAEEVGDAVEDATD